ncbi:MAG: hypothetical protein GTO16_05055 [Candidatus Aminicenantes bacterium]|nr:hypothetical protein [Candidatus Aminicenantes bacterium]
MILARLVVVGAAQGPGAQWFARGDPVYCRGNVVRSVCPCPADSAPPPTGSGQVSCHCRPLVPLDIIGDYVTFPNLN